MRSDYPPFWANPKAKYKSGASRVSGPWCPLHLILTKLLMKWSSWHLKLELNDFSVRKKKKVTYKIVSRIPTRGIVVLHGMLPFKNSNPCNKHTDDYQLMWNTNFIIKD